MKKLGKVSSEGLEYTLGEDEIYYMVSGVGRCTAANIVIPAMYEDLPVIHIADFAFENRTALKRIEIPDSVTGIGDEAFYGCTSLTSVKIGDFVTAVGIAAFGNCIALTSVEIGAFLTNIGAAAFGGCTSLSSIIVDKNNRVYQSIDGNVYSKNGKKLIQYAMGKTDSSFTFPSGVTAIGDRAFYTCERLTSIAIPSSVTTIGNEAFSTCRGLTSVTIGNGVLAIGSWAFSGCESLTSITFSGTVEQWNGIEKGDNWSEGVAATKVVCADGEVVL